jgi:Bacterial SH3 domain
MALIRCYDCGKEISSLAMACPSCGAPPRPTTIPPPLPTQSSRAKQLSWGTIALLTGVVLVLVIRGVTHQSNSLSVATSPTPATREATTTSSPPVETASQSSSSLATTEIPTGEANTMNSPPVETASQSSSSLATTEIPTGEANTTSSPPAETASQTSPSLATTEIPTGEANTTSSPPPETASQSSPSLAATETPSGSDASVATAPPLRATYQVVGIPVSDYLNVREGAGSDYQVVTKLEPGTGGILLGSKRITNGATTWQEITVHGQTGWINAAYIALETQAPPSPTESSTAP